METKLFNEPKINKMTQDYFEGIYIHKGNTAKDSLGCIIVGYNDKKGWVSRPTVAMNKLMAAIEGYDKLKVIIQ